jgi:uncharacterized repeat protein (TIGR01451 family)
MDHWGDGSATNGSPTADINLTSPNNFNATQGTSVAAWDVTIRAGNQTSPNTPSASPDIPGRLYTYNWAAFTGNNGAPVFATLYFVALDGFKYRVDTNGLDPNGYAFYGSHDGLRDTDGSPLHHDIMSTIGPLNDIIGGVSLGKPEFPIFFNDPAQATLNALNIPTSPDVPQISNLAFNGNIGGIQSTIGGGGTITFNSSVDATYEIVISRDGQDFDPTLPQNYSLRGVAHTGSNTVTWNGKDSSGANFPAGTGYVMQATIEGGEFHFPLIDVENNTEGGPRIELMNAPGGNCPLGCTTGFYDDRGYTTHAGTNVGTPGMVLCGGNQPNPPNSDPVRGFDTTSKQRAFGYDTGGNTNVQCTGGFGDAKALDTWALYPGNTLEAPLDIVPASIIIRKTTLGGIGTFEYVVSSPDGTPSLPSSTTIHQMATTTLVGTPVEATGDDLTQLAIGTYLIGEQPTVDPTGLWTSESVNCSDGTSGQAASQVQVTLTSQELTVTCDFTNQFGLFTPVPTEAPTSTPTITPTATPTECPTHTPTVTLTPTSTVLVTTTPTGTAVVTETLTATPEVTSTASSTPEPSNTPEPSSTPSPTDTPEPSTTGARLVQQIASFFSVDASAGSGRLAQEFDPCATPMATPSPPTPQPTPSIVVGKSVEPDSGPIGQQVTYTISVNNPGPVDLIDVEVVDSMANGLTYVSSSPPGTYNADDHAVQWQTALRTDGSQQFTILATIDQAGVWANTACAGGVDAADREVDNCSDASVTGIMPSPTPTAVVTVPPAATPPPPPAATPIASPTSTSPPAATPIASPTFTPIATSTPAPTSTPASQSHAPSNATSAPTIPATLQPTATVTATSTLAPGATPPPLAPGPPNTSTPTPTVGLPPPIAPPEIGAETVPQRRGRIIAIVLRLLYVRHPELVNRPPAQAPPPIQLPRN